ncbi:MAG: S41 family peptidase, partial [bacterium]|nr:S41 family peptidase [bacterium]
MRFVIPKLIITFILAGLLILLSTGVRATDDGRLPIFDSKISPDGNSIAFTWLGDIWIADIETGCVSRVTDNVAHDWGPVWFPDGTRLAFTSNRDGNDDVYTVPVSGGTPTRHTWYGNFDVALDVAPDQQSLLIRSPRRLFGVDLYEVNLEGGLPKPITNALNNNRCADFSSDGNTIVVCCGSSSWTRRDYNGSGDTDLFLVDRDGQNIRWIENSYNGLDYWPCYGPGDEYIYFVSDRDGNENAYRIPSNGGNAEKLTDFQDRPVLFLSISSTGRIAFIQDFKLWYMDPGGSPRQVVVSCVSEPKHSEDVRYDISGHVSEVETSPLSNYLAIVVRGDIFLTPFNNPHGEQEVGDERFGESIRITNTTARECEVTWHPDGDRLAFVSDIDGNREVYEINLRTLEWTRLTNSPEEEYLPIYSPDGKQLGFFRANTQLVLLDLESKTERVVLDGVLITAPWPPSYQWSPDSRWIGITHEDELGSPEVFVLNIENDGVYNDPVNVTVHHDADYFCGWAKDGKSLYFLSERDQTYGINPWGSWGLGYTLYSLPLKSEPPPRSDFIVLPDQPVDTPEVVSETEISTDVNDETGNDTASDDTEKIEEQEISVDIDFYRIHERARLISSTRTGGWWAGLSPDCSTFVYDASPLGVPSLWTVPFNGGSATYIADVPDGFTDIEWVADGSGVIYLTNGQIYYWNKSSVSYIAVTGRLDLDMVAERNQMIDETGRILANHFYDPDMHGTPWDQNVEYYRTLVQEASSREDFVLLMNMLFGELDASHLGCWGGGSNEGIGNNPGYLGLEFNAFTEGPGLEVTRVYARSPVDYPDTKIEVGEWVQKINGTPVSTSNNYWKLLDDSTARTVTLTVTSGQYTEDFREIEVSPVTWYTDDPQKLAWYDITYLDWVDQNQQIVDEQSGGRIGYEHIRGMSGGPLERFARQLFSENFDKEALILDVRFNGGGNTHEQLLDILSRPQLGFQRGREEELVPQPAQRWDRPIVLLINEQCFSDSEIFPAGFKALGLGTVMGVTTWGGVIGTWDISLV